MWDDKEARGLFFSVVLTPIHTFALHVNVFVPFSYFSENLLNLLAAIIEKVALHVFGVVVNKNIFFCA